MHSRSLLGPIRRRKRTNQTDQSDRPIRQTNQTQKVYSHTEPTRRRNCRYILTTDQSDALAQSRRSVTVSRTLRFVRSRVTSACPASTRPYVISAGGSYLMT
eukprot:379453-Pyramimonas_sp.AAC.1